MNIYRHETRSYGRSTLAWSVALVALCGLMLAFYPSFAQDAEVFLEVLASMPDAVLNAMGIQLESITSLIGYYSYIFVYISLCGAIQAMYLGTSILSKETREKTADFLMAKPTGRAAILTAKLMSALTSILATNAVYLIGAIVMAEAVKTEEYSRGSFLLISLTMLFLQLIFLMLGAVAALLAPRLKTVLPLALGTVFGFFMISVFTSTSREWLRFVTPFKYFDYSDIVARGGYEPVFLAIGAAIIVVCAGFCFIRYCKRDVPVG